jgi:hypothetical protein
MERTIAAREQPFAGFFVSLFPAMGSGIRHLTGDLFLSLALSASRRRARLRRQHEAD